MNWVEFNEPGDEHEDDREEEWDEDFDCGNDDDGSRGFGGYGELGDDDPRLYDNGGGDFEPFDGLPDGMGPDGE